MPGHSAVRPAELAPSGLRPRAYKALETVILSAAPRYAGAGSPGRVAELAGAVAMKFKGCFAARTRGQKYTAAGQPLLSRVICEWPVEEMVGWVLEGF